MRIEPLACMCVWIFVPLHHPYTAAMPPFFCIHAPDVARREWPAFMRPVWLGFFGLHQFVPLHSACPLHHHPARPNCYSSTTRSPPTPHTSSPSTFHSPFSLLPLPYPYPLQKHSAFFSLSPQPHLVSHGQGRPPHKAQEHCQEAHQEVRSVPSRPLHAPLPHLLAQA